MIKKWEFYCLISNNQKVMIIVALKKIIVVMQDIHIHISTADDPSFADVVVCDFVLVCLLFDIVRC